MYVEMDNGGQFTIDMTHPLITMLASSLHCVVSCIEVFCVLGNDFSGLMSQLRSVLYSGYVLYINFIGRNKSGLN